MKKSCCLFLLAAIALTTYAQQDCETVAHSPEYFSVTATAATEHDARINALSLLVENISSLVSSKTEILTKNDHQTFYNTSKATSVLHLKGVTYLTCDKSRKNAVTVLAFISKKDLEQSSTEVTARVRQYIELMEQKEAKGLDALPDAYIAYLHTFTSPYAIEYHSDTRHIGNVRAYLESFLRTYLSNISVTCSGVTENPDYPDQQLTLSLSLNGTQDTRMKFLVDLPEYGARGYFDHSDNSMDVIMTPDGMKTRFSGKLSLAPPPVEADLKDISELIQISREVSFEADMSNIIKLDFQSREVGEDLVLMPVARHLMIRQLEWLSEGRLLTTEQRPKISAIGLKALTLRVNGSQDLMITKTFNSPAANKQAADDNTGRQSEFTYHGASFNVELIHAPTSASTPGIPNTSFPEDAIVFVHTDIPNLVFRSSMSGIDRQIFNSPLNRYEIFVQPMKQLLIVEAGGAIEKSMGIINPQPKDEIHFSVNAVPAETRISQPAEAYAQASKGLIAIASDPPNASIFINDIETVYRTPFIIMIPDGFAKITLRKKYYQPVDTVIHIDYRNAVNVMVRLVPIPGYVTKFPPTSDALSYLQGRREGYNFAEVEIDPVKQLAQDNLRNYQRETLSLRRKATVAYSTAALGFMFGLYYNWLDRLLYDNTTGHSSMLGPMAGTSYVIGGVSLVAGIIYSAKLSNLKKKWMIQPAPNARGMGVALTFKF